MEGVARRLYFASSFTMTVRCSSWCARAVQLPEMPKSTVDRLPEIFLSFPRILYSAAYSLHCSIVGILRSAVRPQPTLMPLRSMCTSVPSQLTRPADCSTDGLRALVSRCYEVIGMAKECRDMRELRDKVARHYGRQVVQFSLSLPCQQRMNERGRLSWRPYFGGCSSPVNQPTASDFIGSSNGMAICSA
jgi:hypothetical protein